MFIDQHLNIFITTLFQAGSFSQHLNPVLTILSLFLLVDISAIY